MHRALRIMKTQILPHNKRYVRFTRPALKHLQILFLLLQTICAFASSAFGQSVPPKPNIIVILADDLGYGDVSYNRVNPDFLTPNIDSLTINGVQFTNGYVTHPFCT